MILLFGASGDIHKKKVYPALFQINKEKTLSNVVGIGRTTFTDYEYHDIVKKSIEGYYQKTESPSLAFLSKFKYLCGDYDNSRTYNSLVKYFDMVVARDEEIIIYCGVPSSITLKIVKGICSTRINKYYNVTFLVEKPFGNSLKEFCEYTEVLKKYISIDHVRFIDHYLAKSAITEIKQVDINKIQKVEITIYETEGVDHRLAYFDNVGLINDMFQGHILSILSKILGKNTSKLEMNDKVSSEIGQYRGYKGDLNIETYFKLRLKCEEVVIHINCGKKMGSNIKEIVLTDKNENEKSYSLLSKQNEYYTLFKNKHNNDYFLLDEDYKLYWNITEQIKNDLIGSKFINYEEYFSPSVPTQSSENITITI